MTTNAEDIREVMNLAFDLYNQKNVEQFLECFARDFSNFYIDNSLLSEGRIDADSLRALYDGGMTPALDQRHMAVRVFGDTALVTGYVTGSITGPEGAKTQGPWRFTALLVKANGRWQIMHNHWSLLAP